MGLVLEFWGRGAGGEKCSVGPPGLPPGVCDPLQPARVWALAEGAGGPVATARVTSGRPGEIWVSQDVISVPRNRFAAPFSTVQAKIPSHLGPEERSRTLGSRRDDQSSIPRSFFRGRRQWPQAISYVQVGDGCQGRAECCILGPSTGC